MEKLVGPFLRHWPLTALVTSAAMLAIAHAFETFGGYAPCMLCLRAREVYWVAGGVALVALILTRLTPAQRLKAVANLLLGLIFAVGVGVAVYHAGAEWKFWPGPAACAVGGAGANAEAMAALLAGKSVKAPACDEAAWVFLGLSMAGWNALISLKLTVLSLIAARRETRA